MSLKLASAGERVRLWDSNNNYQMLGECYPHGKSTSVQDLSWSPDGCWLASVGGAQSNVSVVSVSDNQCQEIILPPPEVQQTCVAFDGTSKLVVSGGVDGVLRLWDTHSRRLHKKYKGHKGAVNTVQFNFNNTHLASGSASGDILLHNVVTGQSSAPMSAKHCVQALRYHYYNKAKLGCVTQDGDTLMWDTYKCSLIHTFKTSHKAPATSLAFSPINDMLLITVGLDKTMAMHDTRSMKTVKSVAMGEPLTTIDFFPDGRLVALGSTHGNIFILDLSSTSMDPLHTIEAHKSSIHALAYQQIANDANKNHVTGARTKAPKVKHLSKKAESSRVTNDLTWKSEHTSKKNSSDSVPAVNGTSMTKPMLKNGDSSTARHSIDSPPDRDYSSTTYPHHQGPSQPTLSSTHVSESDVIKSTRMHNGKHLDLLTEDLFSPILRNDVVASLSSMAEGKEEKTFGLLQNEDSFNLSDLKPSNRVPLNFSSFNSTTSPVKHQKEDSHAGQAKRHDSGSTVSFQLLPSKPSIPGLPYKNGQSEVLSPPTSQLSSAPSSPSRSDSSMSSSPHKLKKSPTIASPRVHQQHQVPSASNTTPPATVSSPVKPMSPATINSTDSVVNSRSVHHNSRANTKMGDSFTSAGHSPKKSEFVVPNNSLGEAVSNSKMEVTRHWDIPALPLSNLAGSESASSSSGVVTSPENIGMKSPEKLSTNLSPPAAASGATSKGAQPFHMEYLNNLINSSLNELWEDKIKVSIQTLHVDMLKEFFMAKAELKPLVECYTENERLRAENRRLEEENRQLKKKY